MRKVTAARQRVGTGCPGACGTASRHSPSSRTGTAPAGCAGPRPPTPSDTRVCLPLPSTERLIPSVLWHQSYCGRLTSVWSLLFFLILQLLWGEARSASDIPHVPLQPSFLLTLNCKKREKYLRASGVTNYGLCLGSFLKWE